MNRFKLTTKGDKPYKGYYCYKPFKWFEIVQNGDVYLCCPSWLRVPVGNIHRQSIDKIWNSKKAQKIRQSILDGSYRFCNQLCPNLHDLDRLTCIKPMEKIEDKEFRKVIINLNLKLSFGPRMINGCFDRSCNLACPSCRKQMIMADEGERKQIKKVIDKITEQAGKDLELLSLLGTGDPLASPEIFQWLLSFDLKKFPKLKLIHLHTNGMLFTPKTWQMLSAVNHLIKSIEISVDAGTDDTYKVNRKGGDFKRLLENLRFIRSLIEKGKIKNSRISFVVQANNFKEMEGIIKIGQKNKFESIYFSQLVNWGTFPKREFRKRAVHLPDHPKHQEFLSVLRRLPKKNQIYLGNLYYLVSKK